MCAALSAGLPYMSQAAAGDALRQVFSLNREWRFLPGDPKGAETADYDDAGWQGAGLPHSFSLPYFRSAEFYRGYGWYRKHVKVEPAWLVGRINVEFDGVFQVAELFVNGRRVGEHRGGYTGFTFDITDAVRTGDNLIAVRVNNLWSPRLAPRAGEHVFSGGIYRDVRLVVTAPLHVAWYGTFVTTPRVSRESALVNVKTEVVNDSAQHKKATIRTAIVDAGGTAVASMESTLSIAPQSTVVFDQESVAIARPKLWHPDHPHLYTVKTTILDDGNPVDDFTSPLGFRWFEFTADQGFFLNGERLYLRGANVHQDHAGWGDAVTGGGMVRDVRLMKEAGFDFIRGSHYPHAPGFSRACDELGMIFWSENAFWGTGGFKGDGYWNASAYPVNADDEEGFEASVKASLAEMIRIHRNHPSIVVWSMSNEPFFTEASKVPKMKKCLAELVALSRKLDPTRPAAIGGAQRPLDGNRIDLAGDLAGYNGDGATIGIFQKPGVPSVVSEYGSTMTCRPGAYEPGWGDLEKQQGKPVFPWRSGQAIWCGFDHGSIAGQKFGGMGIVDYFRLPKRMWYWYRNEYRGIPPPEWPSAGVPAGLVLTADKAVVSSADGRDDALITVTVVDARGKAINNCPPVRLAIESGPGEFPTGREIHFDERSDIAILDGLAAIEFRSYHAGISVIRASSPGLKDATLELRTEGGPVFVEGRTPLAPTRPYVRYSHGHEEQGSVRFGQDNPTHASSEAPGHGRGMANDGKADTYWQAEAGDTNAWWSVDLERLVTVRSVTLGFPWKGGWDCRLEVSDDGKTGWQPVGAARCAASGEATVSPPPVRGRFLRVVFAGRPAGTPAALSRVEVHGVL